VKARAAGTAESEIAGRKKRHAQLGIVGAAFVAAIVVLVAFGMG
jgi:hypothetical protein